MTAIVTAVALFFLLQLPLQNDEKASVQPEVFFDIKVKEILIAKSKSETSFQASSMSNMHTIKIDNDVDVTFKTEVEQLFKNLKSLSTPPTYNTPAYDMKVSQEVGNPLKIKIWESEGNIYLYNMTEDKFYTSFHRSAFNVYSMMKNIPPLQ